MYLQSDFKSRASLSQVEDFLVSLYRWLVSGDREGVAELYETQWVELGKKTADVDHWPSDKDMATVANGHELVVLLGRLLRERSLMAGQSSIHLFAASWRTHLDLFALAGDARKARAAHLDLLPMGWLFEIMAQFVQLYSKFHSEYRHRRHRQASDDASSADPSKVEEENALIAKVWTTPEVLKQLSDLVDKTEIRTMMSKMVVPATGSETVGFYALVNLCRLQAKLCNFDASAAIAEGVHLDHPDVRVFAFAVPKAAVTLCYFAGFSMIMQRRYARAVDTLSLPLRSDNRALMYGSDSNSLKKLGKITSLVAVSSSLCPGHPVDRTIADRLEDKYRDQLRAMQIELKESEFEALFTSGCVDLVDPEVGEAASSQNSLRRVVAAFKTALVHRLRVLTLRSYLAAYINVAIPNLARVSGISEAEIRSVLTTELVQSASRGAEDGGAAEGDEGLQFNISGDVISVTAAAPRRSVSDDFYAQSALLEPVLGARSV